MTPQPVDGRIALITGANKGIGLEIARQLGAQGVTVLIGARDAQRGHIAVEHLQAERIAAHFVLLDVIEHATIKAAAHYIDTTWGKLDILVNNAGILIDHVPPSELDMETLCRTYATNVFGVFAVTKAMLPLLRRSDAGRIVNMSTVLASLTQTSNSQLPWSQSEFNHLAYNSSKTALNAMTVQFANELRRTPIKINAASPGYVATDLNDHRGPRTVQQGAATPVRLALLGVDGPTGGFFNDDGVIPW